MTITVQDSASPTARPRPLLRAAAGLAVLISAATLVASYSLPTVEFKQVLSEVEIYSIYGGIEMLWLDGNPILVLE